MGASGSSASISSVREFWVNFCFHSYPIRAGVAKELLYQVTKDGWKDATTPNKTSFQLAQKTHLPIYTWLEENPDIRAKYQLAIQVRIQLSHRKLPTSNMEPADMYPVV
jgi:hypothetical protein